MSINGETDTLPTNRLPLNDMKKLLYVYTGGRKDRLQDIESGAEAPLEFLFGHPFLKAEGYDVDILELTDLNPDKDSKAYKELKGKNGKFNRRTTLTSSSHYFIEAMPIINKYEIVIACNEYIALGLSYYKTKKLLKPNLMFFVMGMLSKILKLVKTSHSLDIVLNRNYRTAYTQYKELIENSKKAIFLGEGEYKYAQNLFNDLNKKLFFLPYSIDTDFWRLPKDNEREKSYILFVGNDANRDFDLLKKIAQRLDHQKFVFITSRLKGQELPENVELVEGDWKKLVLKDVEMRNYYHGSKIVIIPLKESLQPSGQSVCLQSMACGIPVMISKTSGFWDPSNYEDKKHLVFVDSTSDAYWADKITKTLNNNNLTAELSKEGRLHVERFNNLKCFGIKLKEAISE